MKNGWSAAAAAAAAAAAMTTNRHHPSINQVIEKESITFAFPKGLILYSFTDCK